MDNNYKLSPSEPINVRSFLRQYSPINIDPKVWEEMIGYEEPSQYGTIHQWSDPAYQRDYGSWNTEKKYRYIESIFAGNVYTPIIFSEVTDTERGIKNIPNNINFACLDGQHRSNALCEFINNKWGFKGQIILDGQLFDYSNEPIYFSKMPRKMQERFLSERSLLVQKIGQDHDKAAVFLRINEGEGLNSQEKRNAMNTHIARWAQIQRKNFESVAKQIKGMKIHRQQDGAMFSRFACYLSHYVVPTEYRPDTLSTLDKDLNKFFVKGIGKPESEGIYNSDVLNYLSSVFLPSMQLIAESFRKNKNSKMSPAKIWSYLIVHHDLYRSNKLTDVCSVKLYRKVSTIVDSLIKASRKQIAEDAENDKEISASDYFHSYLGRYTQGSFISKIRNDITEYVESNEIDFQSECKVTQVVVCEDSEDSSEEMIA